LPTRMTLLTEPAMTLSCFAASASIPEIAPAT
jgi:hypothetical protein